jgi:hypothetical protein
VADVTIKAGDVLIVRRVLTDGDGVPADLTSSTVQFRMSLLRGPRDVVREGAADIEQNLTEDVGQVVFTSEATDDLAGQHGLGYRGDFIVTYDGGEEQTFPGGTNILIAILPRAASEAEGS